MDGLFNRVVDDLSLSVRYSFSGVASEELTCTRETLLIKTEPKTGNCLPLKAVKWLARGIIRAVAEVGYGFFVLTSAIETLVRGTLWLLAQTTRVLPQSISEPVIGFARQGVSTCAESTKNNLLNLYHNLVDLELEEDAWYYSSRYSSPKNTIDCKSNWEIKFDSNYQSI